MNLLRIARRPPLVARPDETVMDAVKKMTTLGIGAVAIVEDRKLVGIFTERDLMNRVVGASRDAQGTPLADVMTKDVRVAPLEMDASEAFAYMTEQHVRHLPIVDADGVVHGMLSIRHLMESLVENLSHELEGLNAYIGADGIGG